MYIIIYIIIRQILSFTQKRGCNVNSNQSYQEIWAIVRDELAKQYSDAVMELWFNHFELVYLDEKDALLTTTSEGFVSILNRKYAPEIAKLFERTLGFPVRVRIYAKEGFQLSAALTDTVSDPAPEPATNAPRTEDARPDAYVYENDYTFENFIVGSSNKLAHAASVAVANHPTAYNPLFLYGASGLGKTHLMKAIANELKRTRPGFNIIFVRGEDFTNELIRAIEKKTTAQFKEKYRSADILLIDDIHIIAGKVSTQEEFFHTFNALYDADKQIVLTSDRPPKDIVHLEERIQSRFEGGLIVDIQPPDTELRIAILKRKAMIMNIDLSDDVLTFLGENVKNNIRQLEGVIKKLGAYSFVNGVPITVDIARSVLSSVISGVVPPTLVAEQVIENISKRYGVSVEDIKGKKRTQEIAMARHIAIYVIRRVTNISLQNTAKIFGRDHTTILSSIDVINKRIAEDSSFEYEISDICGEFTS